VKTAGRRVLAMAAACSLAACGDGSGAGTSSDGSPATQRPPVEVRSAARQRFDATGAETLLVYDAGRVHATGRVIARAQADKAPRLFPSPAVTVIVFRAIGENLAARATVMRIRVGQAYLQVGEGALDEDPIETGLALERLREVDLAATDEALAEAFGLKMEAPPAGAEKGLAFQAGDDVRLPFFLSLR
jgi:hypothetical protein